MRLSQLTKLMDKGELICVDYDNVPIDQMNAYSGKVSGIKRDDAINKCHVTGISAFYDVILVLIEKGEDDEQKERTPKEI